MSLGIGSHTGGARLDIFLDKFTESWPGIIAMDEVNGFRLARMSGKDVVVLVTEDTEPEIVGIRDVDQVVVTEEPVRSNGPTGLRFLIVSNEEWVIWKCGEDVGIELFLIHDDCCTEDWFHHFRSSE